MTEFAKTIFLASSDDTAKIGEIFAGFLKAPATIYLEGDLGAGKTTFVQGFLRGLGVNGVVKSPTFTLVEIYPVHESVVLHADLYRIKTPQELEEMGFRDYFNHNTIALIEWASHAAGGLPKPDLLCELKIAENNSGRLLTVSGSCFASETLCEWFQLTDEYQIK